MDVCSVMFSSYQPHGLYTARLLCPWDFPGKNTWVGCHFLLQGIFLTQESNPCLLCLQHCRWVLFHWASREALNVNIFLYSLFLNAGWEFPVSFLTNFFPQKLHSGDYILYGEIYFTLNLFIVSFPVHFLTLWCGSVKYAKLLCQTALVSNLTCVCS